MARTLSAGQETERVKQGITGLILAKATYDQYGLATYVRRYGTSAVALSGNDWLDMFAEKGLDLGSTTLKEEGGLSYAPGFTLRLRDEGNESDISGTHVISNDEVILYWLFYTGSDVEGDLVELIRGVVTKDQISGYLWTLRCVDGSKIDFRNLPFDTLNSAQYPYAWTPGLPIPEAFGNLNIEPFTPGGRAPALAPCTFTDRFSLLCTSSFTKKTGGSATAWQWYSGAGQFGYLPNSTESNDVLDVSAPERILKLRGSRAKGSNDVVGYRQAIDGDSATSVAIVNTDNLDVWLAGCPKLGDMTALKVRILAAGNYTVTVKDDTTIKSGPSAVSGDQIITLTLGDYSAQWNIALLNVEIDGTASATIEEIFLQIEFDDFLAFQDAEPSIYQTIVGFEDQTAHYTDGAVISGAGTALRNPVHQIAALLRATNLTGLETVKVNSTYLDAAATSRTDWYFDWWFDPSRQVREDIFESLCFQAGLHQWKKEGAWRVVARDKDRSPSHFFLGRYHCPVKGNKLDGLVEWDFENLPADGSQIYNEIAIRYGKHPATGVYQKLVAASGQYRLTGTCSVNGPAETLEDLSATFQTHGVVAKDGNNPGERIYVEGYLDLEVVAVNSQTEVSVVAVDGGVIPDVSSATYYLGPHVDGTAILSQISFKVVNALGGTRQRSFLEQGGFTTDYVQDDATALEMLTYFKQWFAIPRIRIKLGLYHYGIKLEEGDVFLIDCEKLFANDRGVALTELDEDIDTSETVWDVTAGEAGRVRVGDYLYTQSSRDVAPECVLVAAVDVALSQITVSRAQLNTHAILHNTGDTLYRVTKKFLCSSLRPPIPSDPVSRVEAEQMPNDYFPVGICVATGYADWGDASAEERTQSGWVTNWNGRVVDAEPDSEYSHVGPDSGTYVIT